MFSDFHIFVIIFLLYFICWLIKIVRLKNKNVKKDDNIKQNKPNAGVTTHRIKWCDLRCEHADFAKVDALDGSCRTFQSLWCDALQKHVIKNAPCEKTFGRRRPTTGM